MMLIYAEMYVKVFKNVNGPYDFEWQVNAVCDICVTTCMKPSPNYVT
jgi:hypothetical protein